MKRPNKPRATDQQPMKRSWQVISFTAALWLLALGSAVFWGMKWMQPSIAPTSPAAPSAASVGGAVVAVDSLSLAKGLGGGQETAPISGAPSADSAPASSIDASRFALTGVVVHRAGNSSASVALLGVDGKPAQPYRVGASLAEGVVLHSVAAGKAMLAASAKDEPSTTLELPQLKSAVVGTAMAERPEVVALASAPGAESGTEALIETVRARRRRGRDLEQPVSSPEEALMRARIEAAASN